MDTQMVARLLAELVSGQITSARSADIKARLIRDAGVPPSGVDSLMQDALNSPDMYRAAGGVTPQVGIDDVSDIFAGAERGGTEAGRALEVRRRQQELVGQGPFAPFVTRGLAERFDPGSLRRQQQLGEFGGLGPTPMTSGGTRAPEESFRSFMGGVTGGRPSGDVLEAQLRNIFTQLQGGGTFGGNPTMVESLRDPREALRFALEPGRARVAPASRDAFLRGAEREFLNALSNDPGQFKTPLESFEWFAPRYFPQR
jgi:hypothetical protein